MDAIGGQEIRMATLHPSEPWKQTGAWDKVDVVFKIFCSVTPMLGSIGKQLLISTVVKIQTDFAVDIFFSH